MPAQPRRRGRPVAPADDGMVTAELAVGLPTVVLGTVVALAAVGVATAQLRCVDAAAAAARLAARGEAPAVVTSAARLVGPAGAQVRVERVGDTVRADVTAVVHLPGTGRLLPGFVLHEHVVAADETVAPASDLVTP